VVMGVLVLSVAGFGCARTQVQSASRAAASKGRLEVSCMGTSWRVRIGSRAPARWRKRPW
jgi:hypothetical protein